jgi:hypothetical protein
MLEEVYGGADDGKAQIVPRRPQEVLQHLSAEIESKQNHPQELWTALRGFLVADAEFVHVVLVHDVLEFCLAVFDSLEPNVTVEERRIRISRINGLAIPMNLQIEQVSQKLTEKDNAFIGRWAIVTDTSMLAMRQPNPNLRLILSSFATFDVELQQTDHPELVLSVWLYSLYTAIFALAYGTIPAGILGVASFVIGLVIRNAK